MKRYLVPFSAFILLLGSGTVVAERTSGGAQLRPDREPIKYLDKAPQARTPQATMVRFILLREARRIEEAGRLISKECPKWLREAMLKRRSAEHGPLNIDTLRYQLREYSADKAQVGISYNLEDGTYNEWIRDLFREGGKWVLR